MASRKELESRLNANQRKAAFLLVENELKPTEERLTHEEIAAEVGITRQGLYKWRTQNKTFIEYKNLIADDFLSEARPAVYAALLALIKPKGNQMPSVKAIDLFMRRFGLLTDKVDMTGGDSEGGRTSEKLKKELDEIDELLADDDEVLEDFEVIDEDEDEE